MTIPIKSKAELNNELIKLEVFLFVESVYDRSPRRPELEQHVRVVRLARALINSTP